MEAFIVDGVAPTQMEYELKDRTRELRQVRAGKREGSELDALKAMIRATVRHFCNIPDAHRGVHNKVETLQRGILEAEKCYESDTECLHLSVLLNHLYRLKNPNPFQTSASVHRLKERTGRLLAAFPDNAQVEQLVAEVVIDSADVTWWERILYSYPLPPSSLEAVPLLQKAYDREATQRGAMLLGEAYALAGERAASREHLQQCAEWKGSSVLHNAYQAECVTLLAKWL